ncbi:hypothetical protein [Aquimarina addita]
MNKLGNIVDSLNFKYKTCDLNTVFNSKPQTIGHIIRLDTNNIKQAKKDLDNNISFESFIEKYPNSEIEKNVLIIKYKYQNYKHEEVVRFSEVDFNSSYGFKIQQTNQKGLYNKQVENTWLYDYNEKSEYSKESIRAFYFSQEFKTTPLDLKYCRQIGYSDCLIDTLTTKFKNDSKSGWVELPKNWQNISSKKQKKLLDMMRSTKVVGGCSMDSRPREHAIHIALLSAETTNWEVFLKSHLDIMNDRFDRMSDGSYAWAERKTYIKELEELDINVVDLLIGISFRIENPSTNHYYGRIGSLGRAISESKNKEQFKKQMLSMIEDSELDDYNRVLTYFLYISYNKSLENEVEQKENLIQLKQSINKMPVYLSDKIKINQK